MIKIKIILSILFIIWFGTQVLPFILGFIKGFIDAINNEPFDSDIIDNEEND